MRRGVSLAVDVGTARIGVAACDPDGLVAYPVETVTVAGDPAAGIGRVAELAREHEARDVYVGLPLHLSGGQGASARMAEDFARMLVDAVAPACVFLVDERFSSVSAGTLLHQAGRSAKSQRGIVDQAAAQIVLQHVLDAQGGRNDPPGFARAVGGQEQRRNGDT